MWVPSQLEGEQALGLMVEEGNKIIWGQAGTVMIEYKSCLMLPGLLLLLGTNSRAVYTELARAVLVTKATPLSNYVTKLSAIICKLDFRILVYNLCTASSIKALYNFHISAVSSFM